MTLFTNINEDLRVPNAYSQRVDSSNVRNGLTELKVVAFECESSRLRQHLDQISSHLYEV